MKIRGDFVTNSSSVSYILTMKKDMADMWTRFWAEKKFIGLLEFLKKKIENDGESNSVSGEELYTLRLKFNTENAWSLDDFLKEKKKTKYDVDFSELSDDEMLALVYGMVLNGQTDLLFGIGATLVEHY